jgi:hypothetical protein
MPQPDGKKRRNCRRNTVPDIAAEPRFDEARFAAAARAGKNRPADGLPGRYGSGGCRATGDNPQGHGGGGLLRMTGPPAGIADSRDWHFAARDSHALNAASLADRTAPNPDVPAWWTENSGWQPVASGGVKSSAVVRLQGCAVAVTVGESERSIRKRPSELAGRAGGGVRRRDWPRALRSYPQGRQAVSPTTAPTRTAGHPEQGKIEA